MGRLTFCISILLGLSLQTQAQIAFTQLINTGLAEQNQSAADIQNSIQVASADDDSFDEKTLSLSAETPSAGESAAPVAEKSEPPVPTPVDSTPAAEGSAAPPAPASGSPRTPQQDTHTAQEKSRNPASEEMTLRLRPTGRATAARYFEEHAKAQAIARAEARAKAKVAKKLRAEKKAQLKAERAQRLAQLKESKKQSNQKNRLAKNKKIAGKKSAKRKSVKNNVREAQVKKSKRSTASAKK